MQCLVRSPCTPSSVLYALVADRKTIHPVHPPCQSLETFILYVSIGSFYRSLIKVRCINADPNQMAKEKPHLQFEKWAREYGPVYSLMLGTKSMFVISSDQAVRELLDKKSANTSARPELYTGNDLLSGGKRMVMMVYDHLNDEQYLADSR